MKNELGIVGAAKRFWSVAEEWRREPEPRKARRPQSLSLSKGKDATSRKIKSGFVRANVYFCAGLTLAVLIFMIAYILVKGVPFLRGDLFSWKYTSENCSGVPALVNTLLMTVMALTLAVPLGLGSAIYLVEYAGKGNRFVKVVRMTTETLTGIPSIIYGLFGMLLFVGFLHWGYSLLAGAATVAIMILPTIMRTTEEALLAMPDSFREGSFGLGAGKLRTVFKIILPSAVPGILSGIILATGRVVGETAALIYTAGTVAQVPANVMGSGRTLAIHMYVLSSEGLHTGQAFATAVVLLAMVVVINALAALVARGIEK
ncbi:MAG: phosphate ABC transporter permease PstA [Treponema sp.]|nr:phosphate ABC transporter permease PstA [Candidatus Treponema equifaecale]